MSSHEVALSSGATSRHRSAGRARSGRYWNRRGAWTSAPQCGAVMILGEPMARMTVHGRVQRVCAACATSPLAESATVRELPKPAAAPMVADREAA